MTGTWSAVFRGETAQGRCGRELSLVELEVLAEVPDTKRPTYEAMAHAWVSSERCLDVKKEFSKARLVVRGTRVSLSYEAEGWGSEMLVRDGPLLSGIDANGVTIEWHQPPELPISVSRNMVRQNIITNMTSDRIEELRDALIEDGNTQDETNELVSSLIGGLATCVVDVAQVQAAVQRLPFDELLKMYDPISGDEPNPRVVRRVDRYSIEARTRACFFEVAEAAGADVF